MPSFRSGLAAALVLVLAAQPAAAQRGRGTAGVTASDARFLVGRLGLPAFLHVLEAEDAALAATGTSGEDWRLASLTASAGDQPNRHQNPRPGVRCASGKRHDPRGGKGGSGGADQEHSGSSASSA